MIDKIQNTYNPRLLLIIGAITLLALVIALAAGANGDYPAYLRQWALVMDGVDPWSPRHKGMEVPFNAYGPLHAVLGGAVALHPYGPKVFLAICAIAAFSVMLLATSRVHDDMSQRTVLFLALMFPLSPLVVVHTYVYGGNDIFAVLCCIIACELRARKMLWLTGIALGIGALMKFYPLLFVPFLCIGRGGIAHVRPLISSVAVFLGGMLFCSLYLEWDVFSAISGGVSRDPKSLSILRFADSAAGLLNSETMRALVDFLVDKNSLFVIGAAVLVTLWGWLFGINWRIVMLIGTLVIFTIYKVGHAQFFIVWAAVLTWVLAEGKDRPSVQVAGAFFPVLVFLSLLSLKSVALLIAYREMPEYGNLFGQIDYQWRTISSLVLWTLILFGLFRARANIFQTGVTRPVLQM